jgi:hypothetical protein
MQFTGFRDEVSFSFGRDKAADIVDLGLEEASMKDAWIEKFSPLEDVKRIAEKFDLMTICHFKANIVAELSDNSFKPRA